MIWKRVHHFSVAFKLRAELYCEIARAHRLGLPVPKRMGIRIWREPHRYDDFIRFLRLVDPRQSVQGIDCGANEGHWTADFLEFFPRAHMTCLEPVPKTFQLLQSRFKDDRRIVCINAAASNTEGTAKINVADGTERSSFHAYSRSQESFNIRMVDAIDARMIRTDSLTLQSDVDARVLKIDVQGHEVAALEGALGILSHVDVLIVECSFNVEYEGMPPSFSEVCRLAKSANLVPVHFRNFGRSLSPYAWERDVIFAQEALLERLWGW